MPLFNKKESELETQQDKWLYFLKNLANFDSIPSILHEPVFEKAFHTAELAAMSPEERAKYEANLQIYRDNFAAMETAILEGEERGKAIGRAEGRIEGEAKLLVRQLSRRFGQLPKWAESRINKAEPAQLENWADAVLDASNLTEVLGAPDNQ